jgi:propanediol utilization protein
VLEGAARQKRAVVLRRGLAVRCRAAGAGRCAVTVTVSARDARRLGLAKRPRGPVRVAGATGRPGALQARLTKAARTRLARAARVTLVVRATATDGARSATATRTIVVAR